MIFEYSVSGNMAFLDTTMVTAAYIKTDEQSRKKSIVVCIGASSLTMSDEDESKVDCLYEELVKAKKRDYGICSKDIA